MQPNVESVDGRGPAAKARQALLAVEGVGEVALSLEGAVMGTARALIRDVGKLRHDPKAVAVVEPVETAAEAVPVVVVEKAAPKRPKKPL